MTLLVALAAVACDTVAEISFTQRELEGAATNGTLNANACTDTDTRVRLTFSVFDGDDILISPGEVVSGEQIFIDGDEANFTAENISFSDSFLYPSPDIACSGDGDCPAPFSCVPVNPFNPSDSPTACGMSVNLGTLQGSMAFDEGDDEKSIAILVDNSATLGGRRAETNSFDPNCATDRRDQRIAAATGFVLKFATSAFSDDSLVCVVDFAGENVSGVFFHGGENNCLTPIADGDDVTTINSRLGALTVTEEGASPLWAAVTETIRLQLADAPGDRSIVLFTDGPDDSSLAGFEDALSAARDAGVAVHIVHLDFTPGDAGCLIVDSAPGHLDLFAQLACETNGSYQYATRPEDLRTLFENLALTVPAYYQIEAEIVAMAGDLPDDIDVYRLATGIQVQMAGESITIQRAADKTDPVTTNVIDDRLTLFVRPVPPPPEGSGS